MCNCAESHPGMICGGYGCECHLPELAPGDKIKVGGQVFILTDSHQAFKEEPYVMFKTPAEFMADRPREKAVE